MKYYIGVAVAFMPWVFVAGVLVGYFIGRRSVDSSADAVAVLATSTPLPLVTQPPALPVTPTARSVVVSTQQPDTANVATPTDSVGLSTDVGKWELQQSTSALNDTAEVILHLKAEGNYGVFGAPTIVLRCQGGTIDGYVNTGSVVQSEDDKSTAHIRYDKVQSQQVSMGVSKDGMGLFFPDVVDTINKMQDANTFAFGFTPYNRQEIEVVFDVRGLGVAIHPLAQACKK